jgi:hypothetical protein
MMSASLMQMVSHFNFNDTITTGNSAFAKRVIRYGYTRIVAHTAKMNNAPPGTISYITMSTDHGPENT